MRLKQTIGQSFSRFVLIQIILVWIFLFFYNENNKQDHIQNDVVVYYSYVPATFICKDLTLQFVGKSNCEGKYWPFYLPNGGRVIKMSMGMAYMYTPFFFLGHWAAPFLKEPQNGYSAPYQVMLAFGSLVYMMIGFFYLRRLLLYYFNDLVTGIVMLGLFFGSNLFCYSTIDFLMPHVYLFALFSIFLYLTHKVHLAANKKNVIALGLIGGLIALIRPSDVLILIVPAFYGVTNFNDIVTKLRSVKQKKQLVVLFGAAFIIPWIPQFVYWKVVTGDWLFYSYFGEKFFFNSPHILEGLFGYRKGLFIYSPLILIAVIGIVLLRKRIPQFFLPTVILLPVFTYVVLSWWCWWYGGSFGQRSFIDIFPLLAFPLACVVDFFNQRRFTSLIGLLVLEIIISLNLFQIWQYKKGLIHYDAMTKEAYWSVFLSSSYPSNWAELINDPDYERAKLGEKENVDFNSLNGKVNIRASNFKYISCDVNVDGGLSATRENCGDWETLEIENRGANTFYLKGSNNKYVFIDENSNNELVARGNDIKEATLFTAHSTTQNKFSFGFNDKFVCTDKNLKLSASCADGNSPDAQFKFYPIAK